MFICSTFEEETHVKPTDLIDWLVPLAAADPKSERLAK